MTEDLLKDSIEHGYEEYTKNEEKTEKGCGCGRSSEGGCCQKPQSILIHK